MKVFVFATKWKNYKRIERNVLYDSSEDESEAEKEVKRKRLQNVLNHLQQLKRENVASQILKKRQSNSSNKTSSESAHAYKRQRIGSIDHGSAAPTDSSSSNEKLQKSSNATIPNH